MAAQAVTVNVATPGTLSTLVGKSETQLTVTGKINALDFDYIRELSALRSLDLSGASVEAYKGDATATSALEYPANVLPDCALLGVPATTLVLPAGIVKIDQGAVGNSAATSIVIPSTVTEIDARAFSSMPALKQVTVPASVKVLGDGAFKDCPLLEKVVILGDLKEIAPNTFANCEKLSEVSLPASVTAIGDGAFAGCTALKQISLPAQLKTIGDAAFAQSGLATLDLSGTNVAEVGARAFAECKSLTDVTVRKAPVFGAGAFSFSESLATPAATLLGDNAQMADFLLYGTATSAANLNESQVSEIGAYALSGLKDSNVALPATLKHLGDHAMERMPNISKIDVTAISEVPTLGKSVWEDVDQPGTVLYVPQSMFQAYKDAPQWQDFNVSEFSATDITPSDSDAGDGICAAFDGQVLNIESDVDILSLQVYDVAGRCLTILNAAGENVSHVNLDTAPLASAVLLVRLLRADGTTPVLKVRRP